MYSHIYSSYFPKVNVWGLAMSTLRLVPAPPRPTLRDAESTICFFGFFCFLSFSFFLAGSRKTSIKVDRLAV